MRETWEIPNNWEWKSIGDVSKLISGQHILTENYNENGKGMPYLTGPNDFQEITPNVSKWTETPKAMAEEGDVLITVKGANVGKTNTLDIEQAAISRQLMAIRSSALHSKFLFYFIRSRFQYFQKKGEGSTVPGLNRDQVLGTKIPVPPKTTQENIVKKLEEILSKVESGEKELDEVSTKIDRYSKSILKSALQGDLNKRNGDIQDDLFEEIEADDIPDIPNNWKAVQFKKLFRERLRNGKSAKASKTNEGIRTLTLSAVTNRDFSDKNTKVTVADPEEVEDLWLQSGDILIERSNTPEYVGLSALYMGTDDYAIFPDLMVRVRVDEEVVLPKYVEYVLRSGYARNYFRKNSKGTSGSMAKINQSHIREFPFLLPPMEEQQALVNQLDEYFAIIEDTRTAVEQNSSRAENLRKVMLSAAFKGDLVSGHRIQKTQEENVVQSKELVQTTLETAASEVNNE